MSSNMKVFVTVMLAAGFVLLLSGLAGAQELEDGTVLPEQRILVTEVLDVEQGSQCQAHSLNNISVYPPNLLQLIKGRGGEHDADMSFHPIERASGEDVVIDFVATGGDIQAWIFYESEPAPGTSIDAVPITCTPPPPDTTTTTTSTTSTTVPTTPTTGTTVPPVDTCPDDGLACSGQTTTPLLVGGIILTMMGLIALVWGRQFA